jgi:hypothetical protein
MKYPKIVQYSPTVICSFLTESPLTSSTLSLPSPDDLIAWLLLEFWDDRVDRYGKVF